MSTKPGAIQADDSTEPNPDYIYLERIILAVQHALRQEQHQEAA